MRSQHKITEMMLGHQYSEHVFLGTIAGAARGGLMVHRAGDGDGSAPIGPCAYSRSIAAFTVLEDHPNHEDDPDLDPIPVTYLELKVGDLVKVQKIGAVHVVEYKVMTTEARVFPA